MLKIREIKKSDFLGIKKLFSRNHLQMMQLTNWKNLWNNPLIKVTKKKLLGFVLVKNTKIVGHIGLFPTEYFFKNKKIFCNVLHGWVIDKRYRNSSILLMTKFLSNTKNNFYLSSTTNKKAGKIMKIFKWIEINLKGLNLTSIIILNKSSFLNRVFLNKNFPLKKFFILLISNFLGLILINHFTKWKNHKSKPNIQICKIIGLDFDGFFKEYRIENKNKILLKKNSKWLNWLLNTYIKNKRLKIFIIKEKKKIFGYCIFIIKKKNNIKSAELLDIATLKSHEQDTLSLIKNCIEEANKENCAYFEIRNTIYKNHKILEKFKPIEIKLPNNYFYFKSNTKDNINSLYNIKNFHLSSLDGDIVFNY